MTTIVLQRHQNRFDVLGDQYGQLIATFRTGKEAQAFIRAGGCRPAKPDDSYEDEPFQKHDAYRSAWRRS